MDNSMLNSELNKNIKNNILKRNFKTLSEYKIEEINRHSVIKKYQKGDLILNKENCKDSIFILLDGIIQIGYLSPLGRFHAFNYFSEKSPMNLAVCINQQAIDYNFYAFNQVRVLQFPMVFFEQEIKNNNNLMHDALSIISVRMQQLLEQMKFLQVANLHQKVCKIIIDLSQQYGTTHHLGTEIQLKISQHDLADLLSSSRQTINKEIKQLSELGVIYWQYENIIVKDEGYLKSQVNWI